MERKVLVNEIADFCFDYGLFNKTVKINEIKNRIDRQLEEIDFIESLINTIMVKAKSHENIDIKKLKELLIELEKIRLKLEYGE